MAHSKLKIGDRNGMLEIVDFTHEIVNEKRIYYCICKCDCGNTATIRRSNFGKAASCGCLKNINGSIGDRNGLLTVIDRFRKVVGNRTLWYSTCQCECGNIKEIASHNFSKTKSCGCITRGKQNFSPFPVGGRFGKLEIKEILPHKNYLCICDCGNATVVYHYNLKNETKSCGCLKGPAKNKVSKMLNSLPIGTIDDFLFISEAADLWGTSIHAIKDRIKQAKIKGTIETYVQKGWIRQYANSGNWLLSKNMMVEWYGEQPMKNGEKDA